MVRQVQLEAEVSGVGSQAFFDMIFGGKEALLTYHIDVDGSPSCSVGDWEEGPDGRGRTVTFSMAMQLPAMLCKLIGADVISVQERQVACRGAGASLVLRSSPVLEVIGGSNFTTEACFEMADMCEPQFGCKVHATVTCGATGPWGVVAAIEGTMAEQAEASVGRFLRFCKLWCQERMGRGAASPCSPTAHLAEAGSDADRFYDSLDTASQLSYVTGGMGHSGEGALERLGEQVEALQAGLHEVRSTLKGLRRDVAACLSYIEGGRPQPRAWQPFATGCLAGALACLLLSYTRSQVTASLCARTA